MAMGCSTNAIIHLIAMARRAGQDIGLDDFERYSRRVPVIGNVRPSGDKYLMEDFFYAGGIRALMSNITRAPASRLPHRHRPDARREHRGCEGLQRRRHPPHRQPDLRRGLAGGAEGQPRAGWLRHQAGGDGPEASSSTPARRWCSTTIPSMKKAVDDESCDITADHVLVLRNAGPQGGPGMPEWGMLPMPKKLLKKGHRDMLRLSDARMSGTSYGACVLHVAPESYHRRAAGAAADRRHRHARRRCARSIRHGGVRRGAGAPPGGMDAAGARASSAAMAGCSPSTSSRPTRAATSTSCAPISARRCPNPSSTEGARHDPARARRRGTS